MSEKVSSIKAEPGKHQGAGMTAKGGVSFFKPLVQPKLTINQPNDQYEQEADAVADRVMRMQDNGQLQPNFFKPAPPVISRMCDHCKKEKEGKEIQREETDGSEITADAHLEKYVDSLGGNGEQLSSDVRSFYENRIGYDFSSVRVHTDTVAAKSAQSINALAYTSGNNIVFNSGQYAPGTDHGKRLLGHELTHVVQQSRSVQPKRIQRATVDVNGQRVTVDYSDIIYIADYLAGSQSLITSFTGAAPAAPVVSRITALTATQQQWLLFAMDVLSDNTTAVHAALNRTDAVDRLITRAASATTRPLGGNITNAQLFARDVLVSAGWTDVALTTGLSAPGAASQAIIDPIINPPATGGGAPGPLDVAALNARLVPAITTLLTAIDPANRTTVGRQSMTDIRAIGDLILAEARSFFSPLSDASAESVFNVTPAWTASANILDTTARASNQARRMNYLRNRANIVGRNATITTAIPDANIFTDVNFDGTRPADLAELVNIITTMEADPAIQPVVDRLVLHTGFQTGSGITTTIGIDPEFNSTLRTECEARWQTIDTLCHEVLHALVHPVFQNSSSRIGSRLVVSEGFAEVLGNELFNNRVITKASSDPVFKASLEAGITGTPCPVPAAGTIGYGAAGAGAETIRTTVGDSNFRAAYFLGRPDLIGI